MIHDATVEVTCDNVACQESVYVGLDYVYPDYSGKGGRYNTDDDAIEENLINEHDWIVSNDKHYCHEECMSE